MEVLLFLLAAAVVAVVAYLQWRARERRRIEVAAFATKAGLAYTRNDPFGTVHLPFALFDEGDGRGVENVCAGRVGDLPVRLFDFWWYDESVDGRGNRSKRYTRASCALVPLAGVWCPRLVVAPETLLSRMADVAGFRDIQLESEDFNRAFQIRSRDERFAFAALDARMMTWLLSTARSCRLEVMGDALLVSTDQLRPERLWDLLAVARGFRERLPAVIRSLYPPDTGGKGSLFEARWWLPPLPEAEASGWFPRWTL